MTDPSRPGPMREAVIDLDAVRSNVAALRERIPTPFFLSVVKANAYGHGMVEVARAALAGGATHLGVVDIAEALTLRRAGIDAPVLTWLHDPADDFCDAVGASITVTVSTRQQLDAVARAAQKVTPGRPALIHIKVDTGLSRNGAAPDDWDDLFARAVELESTGLVDVEGVWSHLSNATDEDDLAQGRRFDNAIARAREAGLAPRIRHLSASEAALTLPQLAYDMVRIGIAMYGISPIEDLNPVDVGLKPVMTLRARVAAVRTVPEGTGVSYDFIYRTNKPTTLALVPLGYGEGIPRAATDRAPVMISGNRLRVSGRVAMDQFIVDCGETPVDVGDEVVLFGDPQQGYPSVHDWAFATNTIGYEVVTRLGGRLTRTFIGG